MSEETAAALECCFLFVQFHYNSNTRSTRSTRRKDNVDTARVRYRELQVLAGMYVYTGYGVTG